jgi:hypothetical protein
MAESEKRICADCGKEAKYIFTDRHGTGLCHACVVKTAGPEHLRKDPSFLFKQLVTKPETSVEDRIYRKCKKVIDP